MTKYCDFMEGHIQTRRAQKMVCTPVFTFRKDGGKK